MATELQKSQKENFDRQIGAIDKSSDRQIVAIDKSMERMQTGIQTSIKDQTYTMVASQAALDRTMGNGFDSVTNTLDMGFAGVSNQLGYMTASFSMGMERLAGTFYKMSEEICDRLDAIHDIVNNPLLTQARERYRRALDNYKKGFFEEALEDIKAAVEKNKTDYISWFLKGTVYDFGEGEFSNVKDRDQAISDYTQAAKYISPDIAESGDARNIAAEIWFYLGRAQYEKTKELLQAGNKTEAAGMLAKARNAFERSWQHSGKMLEARYQADRCATWQQDTAGVLRNLEMAILADRWYAVRALNDPVFKPLAGEIEKLIEKMKQDIFSRTTYEYILAMQKELASLGGTASSELRALINKWLPAQFTLALPYFDVRDGYELFPSIAGKLGKELDAWKVEMQRRAETEAKRKAAEAKAETERRAAEAERIAKAAEDKEKAARYRRNEIISYILGGIIGAITGPFSGAPVLGGDNIGRLITCIIVGVVIGIIIAAITRDAIGAGDGTRSGAISGAIIFAIVFAIICAICGQPVIGGFFIAALFGAIGGAIIGLIAGSIQSDRVP
jgi:tetratricopeptide (TPR) repeat protein